jgi:hypothetical protein
VKNKEENVGGELTDLPNEKYKKFFDHFQEIDSISIDQYKPVHLISYFCRKYRSKYNIRYEFKFNTPNPSTSFEIFQIKRLAQLLSSKPSILIRYIDWVFAAKVSQLKRRFTSISFLTKEENVNEYKRIFLLGQPIQKDSNMSRTVNLPAEYLDVLAYAQHSNIKTYGDLTFADQVFAGQFEWEGIISTLQRLGLDRSALKRIV